MTTKEKPSLHPEQVIGFMDGSTLSKYQDLVERVDTTVAEQLRLAGIIEKGVQEDLVTALAEVFKSDPSAKESPVIKMLDAQSKPHHKHMPLLNACINADVPAYLYGEASSGKSTAAKNAADLRSMQLRAISLSPQTSKGDLLGYRDANGNYNRTGFREIYEHGGIFLFDEIDNSNPSTLAIMNRALAGWENEFADSVVERNWNTRIVAAANTIGKGATAQYVGRNPIDAATLDRFAMIPWDIDEYLEDQIMGITDGYQPEIDLEKGGVPTKEEWLDEVRGYRSRVQANGLRVIISTRCAIYGGKLAEQGIGMKWLNELLIYRGMNETDRRKIGGGI